MGSNKIPYQVAKKLMDDYGADKRADLFGRDVWKKNNTVISLKKSDFIDFDLLHHIAIDQLELPMWEFDYWLGENSVLPN